MGSRSKSSGRWLKEHFDDEFVQRAQREGWRSRGVFKLEQIDRKDRLLKPGMRVLDLGAAPGGWSQYAARRVGRAGRVIATDLLPMDSIAGVAFLQGDFREESVVNDLLRILDNQPVDLVLSDMAPNMSGVKGVDQPRAMYLAELALDLATQVLEPGGGLLIKVFQGEGFDALLKDMRTRFGTVSSRKPRASRDRSRELYLLARNYGM
jgi:23S rRNA (uridine2552-2'-O)-methyltransferase